MAVLLGLLMAGLAAFLLREKGPHAVPWLPDCLFHKFTTLHCPGCGMTRAAYASFHGEIAAAFRFNPVGMVLLPLALFGIAIELVGWVRGKPLPFRLSFGIRGTWAIVVIVISFWIFRNLPWWPFTLLAPH